LGQQGHDGFYRGHTAQQLVDGVRHAGGIWTLEDLKSYRIIERDPVVGQYHNVRIVSAAPPSSGGIALLTSLNILAEYDLKRFSAADRVHVIVEAMRRAYHDRALYLGDPDFVTVPVQRLIHPLYADGLRATLRLDRATPSTVFTAAPAVPAGPSTTHFSILDTEGNRVAATLSINLPFGAAFVPPGTGILLNNEMDDFSVKPGTPNAYGLIGADANAIAPNKRPLSSMTPTFLETPDRVGILGTPGGSRIISMVLLATLEFADGQDPDQWVKLKRFHHQFWPDTLQWETGAFEPELVSALSGRGHTLEEQKRPYGNMQAVLWDKRVKRVVAASDPRGIGTNKIISVTQKRDVRETATR
jgi:gamma-glutamyltranspeptidase/glutathione hydrolase